jgi:hypothetical protein
MFYRKIAHERDNPVNNPNIYNVEGDNMSTTLDNWKCVENMFFKSGSLFFILEIIVFSSTK